MTVLRPPAYARLWSEGAAWHLLAHKLSSTITKAIPRMHRRFESNNEQNANMRTAPGVKSPLLPWRRGL